MRVVQHLFVGGDVDVRNVADHQDTLLDFVGIANEIVHLAERVIVFLGVVVELLHLLKSIQGILDRLTSSGNFFDRVGNVARKIGRVSHHPLGMSLSTNESGKQ